MFANVDVVSVILALCVFQQHVTEINANVRRRRSVIVRSEEDHWPNNEVPYAFNTTHAGLISAFEIVTAELAAKTCIKFTQVDRNSTKHKVVVDDTPGDCYSVIAYAADDFPNNEQIIRIDTNTCLGLDILRHEIQHTLGVIHQQAAYDRDKYIRVIEENVDPKRMIEFEMYDRNDTSYFGTKYDFRSSMHYDSVTGFSINGSETMVAHDPEDHNMIQQRANPRLSFYDLMALNNAYKCGEKCRGECDGYFDKRCRCITPNNIMFGGTVANPKWPPKNPPNYKAPVNFDGIDGVLDGIYSMSRARSDLPGQYFQPNVGKSFRRNRQGINVYYIKERDEFIVPLASNKIAEGLFLGNKYLYPEDIADLKQDDLYHLTDEYGRVWLVFWTAEDFRNEFADLAMLNKASKKLKK